MSMLYLAFWVRFCLPLSVFLAKVFHLMARWYFIKTRVHVSVTKKVVQHTSVSFTGTAKLPFQPSSLELWTNLYQIYILSPWLHMPTLKKIHSAVCEYLFLDFLTEIWKTDQAIMFAYSILLSQVIAALIHYPCTVALPGLADWSVFL